jgi:epoxyqueuosine reductase
MSLALSSAVPSQLRAQLEPLGLNLSGIASGDGWDHVLPGCRSVWVVASGGPTLWRGFEDHLRKTPTFLAENHHPFDRFVAELLPPAPSGSRWVRCAADETELVDFRRLAASAGLGWLSRTGLLLHPKVGLWIGLRAALFSRESWPLDDPQVEASPCGTCPAPCVSACPGGAMSATSVAGEPSSWDWRRCATWRDESPDCRVTCATRNACPVGANARYPVLAQHYHNDHGRDGRMALARALGGDAGEGPRPIVEEW